MKKFLGSFWTWTASLAGVAALYVGAVAIKETLIFWIVVGCGAFLAGVRPTIKSAVDLAIRIRNYPKLLEKLGEAASETEAARDRIHQAEDHAQNAWEEGIAEGRAQILGAVRALEVTTMPEVVGILDDVGTIALAGKYEREDRPPLDARFNVISISSGELKGVVQVSRLDDESGIAWLRCVKPIAQTFWEHLANRVGYDESPPVTVRLERLPLPVDEAPINEVTEPVNVASYTEVKE